MITYQTQKKKNGLIISVLLLAEKSHNSIGLLTDTRNRYYTLTMVTTSGAYTLGQRTMYE